MTPTGKELFLGSFKDRVLAVDILAEVILQETAQPGVEVFLTRIDIGKPYFPICSRPLDTQHASWMADGVQIGYECHSCHTQRKGHEYDIFNDVQGQIRRNYSEYWENYRKAIRELTSGKPHEFKVS